MLLGNKKRREESGGIATTNKPQKRNARRDLPAQLDHQDPYVTPAVVDLKFPKLPTQPRNQTRPEEKGM